ncbi:MAG: DEAD/DEAH box helicase family protein [Desulfitobacteriaceae bacterium]|nr:DEAD/DEAH box helicase family protein [Desulfitobacteriaceae bacterium]MDD4346825.1 DEAD/DEAH box helicase family protein [Desulfitobacteriaceae bacterium]MDD4402149.1 DEAD/DEAH box helicase family protein [Desulfitobacteriaceae bacterium]
MAYISRSLTVVSIQSFNSKELTEITTPDYYDYIVIDEFHHAAAPSYQELLADCLNWERLFRWT